MGAEGSAGDGSMLLGDGAATPTEEQKEKKKVAAAAASQSIRKAGSTISSSGGDDDFDGDEKLTGLNRWQTKGLFFKLSLWGCVGIAVVVSAAGAPTVPIIIMAQVINGLLLPCLAVCLFLCLNDADIMTVQPTTLKNAVVLLCVTITSFLAVHLVLDELSRAVAGPQSSRNDTNHSFGPQPNHSG